MTPCRFENDAEFLDAMFDLLALRAQRLTAARELREAAREERANSCQVGRRRQVADEDATRRLAIFQAREDRLRGELDARSEAHRADPGAPMPGLDRLCQAHQLGSAQRTILTALLLESISEERAERTFEGLSVYGGITVEGISRLLDAETVAERLKVRRIFGPQAALIREGLVVLDYVRSDAAPVGLLGARVKLTSSAFDTLVGDVPAQPAISG
jgi:hypothetical protein